MTVTKFVRQVQLAERLTQTGRGATTLHLESRVAEELGVGLAGTRQFNSASLGDQLEMIRPLLRRYRESRAEARQRTARGHAVELIESLQDGLRTEGDAIYIPVPPLTDLVAQPAFKALRFLPETGGSWSCDRLMLRRVFMSTRDCRDVTACLRHGRMVVDYRCVGGRGQFALLDQRLHENAHDVLNVPLQVVRERVPEVVPPRQAPPAIARSVPSWFREGARALVEALANR